jgi:hypothetical protein
VIEALARWLSGLPDEVVRTLAPPRAALLGRVFPALAALALEPSPEPSRLEPSDERRHLFEAVRTLVGRIAQQHRLVVSIDDLQWADADSVAMLTALLRPPGAPRLVLVIAERSDASAGFVPPCPTRRVDVGPLAAEDAAALAATLLPVESPDTAAAIAAEARGHPLFVMELARAWRPHEAGAVTRLDDALARRIHALGVDARAVVEVVAAAGAPVAQAVVAQAASVALGPLAAVLVRLRDDHLVRTGGLGTEDLVDAYHSRIRTAVLQQLDASRARGIHARLAAALERRPVVDPELLFGHWLEAGDQARARRYAIEAADVAAAAALAFDRAARLYRAALDLGGDDGLALRRKLGAALVNAGRGAEAARVFQEAAASAGEREALDLHRRAAEQLLRSGYIDAGTKALGEVLACVGLRLPATRRAAIASLLAVRVRLRLRSLALRRGGSLDPGALACLDACWSAAVGLMVIDPVRATTFHCRMLRLALDAGDPYRASLALSHEACFIASRSAHITRVARVLHQARALAAECGEPHAHGFVATATGISAFVQGRFTEGLAASEEAERILCTCTGVTWERDTSAALMSWTQIYLGRFAALATRVPDAIREAEKRDDRYLATTLRTGILVWIPLVRGDTTSARNALDEGIHHWSERFVHQHWTDLLARAELDLHTGDAEGALSRMSKGWRSLEKAYVLDMQICRAEALFVRSRAALRRARQLGAATCDGRRLLKSAAADAARLLRERVPYITALGNLLSAGIAAARTDLSTAAALLRRSLAALDASGLALHAAVARLRLADLLGGSEGDALRAAALAYAAREQITAVSAVTDHLAPGFSSG